MIRSKKLHRWNSTRYKPISKKSSPEIDQAPEIQIEAKNSSFFPKTKIFSDLDARVEFVRFIGLHHQMSLYQNLSRNFSPIVTKSDERKIPKNSSEKG
jgi:hypothetical protein